MEGLTKQNYKLKCYNAQTPIRKTLILYIIKKITDYKNNGVDVSV